MEFIKTMLHGLAGIILIVILFLIGFLFFGSVAGEYGFLASVASRSLLVGILMYILGKGIRA